MTPTPASPAPNHAPNAQVHPDQPLAVSVRGIALEQFDRIDEALRNLHSDPDLSVHAARTAMKRLRGLIRLVRDHVGHAAYRSENAVLRDTARKLAPIRDGFTMLRTFDGLVSQYESALGEPAEVTRRYLEGVRADAIEAALADGALLTDVTVTLKTARTRFEAWDGSASPTPRSKHSARSVPNDFSAVASGLRRVYARGRSSMRRAYDEQSAEAFHDWRKRVKYLRYQMEALGPVWPEVMGAQAARLDELGELLGVEHDLAVLEEVILQRGEATRDDRLRTLVVALCSHRRLELRRQARAIAEPLFAEDPDTFVARIGTYWDAFVAPDLAAEA